MNETPQEHLRRQIREAVASSPSTDLSVIVDSVVARVEPMMALMRTYHSQEVDLADMALHHDSKVTEACEVAWGIIANAGGGDWTTQTPEWQTAAARWRDDYWHPLLEALR